ncbi:MAG: hypothetical protein IJ167_01000 [Lachnospiraceae bacterium]|nr:hypothetical protein [Lachnospiraceae bacterium]
MSKITEEGTWVSVHDAFSVASSVKELSFDEYNSVIGIGSDLSNYAVY